MADWRARAKRPATFRGVLFYVAATERSGGRRLAIHEYPFKDGSFAEDTGQKTSPFSIEGIVFGNDYIAARDALVDALNAEGPGELVHPTHGTHSVTVPNFRVRETTRDGGQAEFSIEFHPSAAKAPQPSTVVDAKAAVRISAAATRGTIGADFLAKYAPSTLLGSVTETLGRGSRAMASVLTRMRMETQALANLKRELSDIEANAGALASAPADLLAGVVSTFEALAAGLVNSTGSLDQVSPVTALLTLYGFNPGIRPPGTTASRLIEQQNFDSTKRLFQRLTVVQAAELAIEVPFESHEAAIAARDAVTTLLDAQAEEVNDDVYPSLLQLRADLVKALPGEDQGLAHLVTHTPPSTLPSLVLAHTLYGDLDREADIVTRNRVKNPFFVIGGDPLEVLTK